MRPEYFCRMRAGHAHTIEIIWRACHQVKRAKKKRYTKTCKELRVVQYASNSTHAQHRARDNKDLGLNQKTSSHFSFELLGRYLGSINPIRGSGSGIRAKLDILEEVELVFKWVAVKVKD